MTRLLPLAALLAPLPLAAQSVAPSDRLFHEQAIVLDSHLDTSIFFEAPGWRFDRYNPRDFDKSQVDLPRMEAGGLDGGFFVIYTPQGPLTPAGYADARERALLRAAAIQRVIGANADRIGFATTAEEARRLIAAGRRVAFQSIENSYPLGEDLRLLATFHRMGVRMAGPVHFRNNQLADSATDRPRWRGLSPLGRRWLAEMNRLGMIVDVSHASDDAFDQMLALSKAPIIASHSGPKAILDHPRNLDDARMKRLAEKGGLLMINSVYLVLPDGNEARDAVQKRQDGWWALSPEEQRRLIADKAVADAADPYKRPTFEQFMASLLHAIRVMGADHVGLGADWDGGGGVVGMEDVADLPRITAALRQAGIADADIAKVLGGNLLRLMDEVQAAAARS